MLDGPKSLLPVELVACAETLRVVPAGSSSSGELPVFNVAGKVRVWLVSGPTDT